MLFPSRREVGWGFNKSYSQLKHHKLYILIKVHLLNMGLERSSCYTACMREYVKVTNYIVGTIFEAGLILF